MTTPQTDWIKCIHMIAEMARNCPTRNPPTLDYIPIDTQILGDILARASKDQADGRFDPQVTSWLNQDTDKPKEPTP